MLPDFFVVSDFLNCVRDQSISGLVKDHGSEIDSRGNTLSLLKLTIAHSNNGFTRTANGPVYVAGRAI